VVVAVPPGLFTGGTATCGAGGSVRGKDALATFDSSSVTMA